MNRKFCVTLIVLAVLAMIVSTASAGIIVNVRAISQTGEGYISSDGKTVAVYTPGSNITLGVFATISGTDLIASNETLTTLYGSIQQAHINLAAGTGALALTSTTAPFGGVSPFTSQATVPVTTADSLGVAGSSTAGQSMIWTAPTATPAVNSQLGQEWELGTFQYIATPNPGFHDAFATIQYTKPGASLGSATFKIDGSGKNGTSANLALISVGLPVSVVPEPSTFVMLGLGCLALLAYRRRK